MTKKDKEGLGLIIFVFTVFLSLFVLTYRLKASADKYDHTTLCRTDRDYPTMKVLIDKTDPWNEQERSRLAALIRQLKEQLATDERLAIFVLDQSGTYAPTPVFDMCNPGRGDQANTLYENPRLMQQRFTEKFQAPLDAILEKLLQPGVAPQSPIAESIVALKSPGQKERLIVVSDMMQNSSSVNLYGKKANSVSDGQIDEICQMPNRYEDIAVYLINRQQVSSTARQQVRNFWNRCLNHTSQHTMTWQPL